jgi:hypothetical protein
MKSVILLLAVVATGLRAQETVRTEPIRLTVGTPAEDKKAATLAEWGFKKLPRYHALIIGVSEYANSGPTLQDLSEPVNDAQKLYDVLTTKYAFDPHDVVFLKNATRGQIVDSLEMLAHKVKPEDNLLVFYAGHGMFDPKLDIGYWIPSDAVAGRKSTYLANSQLRDYLKGIASKHTLLISDACFGGSIFAASRAGYDSYERAQFYDIYKSKSRKALTSGNYQEVPDKSVFIEYLVKTLKESEEPYISATSLYTRIYEPIRLNSRVLPQYGAIQDAGDEGIAGSFIFIRKLE